MQDSAATGLLWLQTFQPDSMDTDRGLQANAAHCDVFILGGQSNMAGRGGVCRLRSGQKIWDSLGPCYGELVLCFTGAQQWVVAQEPMHADIDKMKVCGVGPGLIFAGQLLELDAAGRVGLVPCAVGGTCLDEWQPGTDLYQQMIDRTHLAVKSLPSCKLRGLLWYQGESDTDTEMKAQSFGSKLRRLITAVRWGGPLVEATSDAWASFLPEGADVLTCNVWSDRQDVGVPDLPVLQVAITCQEMASTAYTSTVRQAQLDLRMSNVWTVDAMGLELQEDGLHLTTAAQKWLGRELARQYKEAVSQQA